MKKRGLSFLFIITLFSLTAVSASAVVNDTLKVGIRWGDTALEAANLENAVDVFACFVISHHCVNLPAIFYEVAAFCLEAELHFLIVIV